MSIFVKTEMAATQTLEVTDDDTVASLKDKIEARTQIPRRHQRLRTTAGKNLDDERVLFEYGDLQGSTLFLHCQ
jgi:hypothetical protein